MKQWIQLLENILVDGEERGDRTGVGTLSIFGGQVSFDLRDHFPLVTMKKTLWKSAFIEMLWFLRGENNTAFLKAHNVPIWDDWQKQIHNIGSMSYKRPIVNVKSKRNPVPIEIKEMSDFELIRNLDTSSLEYKLHYTWWHMLMRCYNKQNHNYGAYGGAGIFVDSRWHVFQNFVEDVQKLSNWEYKKNEWDSYELDKDYFDSNFYGLDSCVWLHKNENLQYRQGMYPVKVTDSSGKVKLYLSVPQVSNDLGIPLSTLHHWMGLEDSVKSVKSKNTQWIGWKFEKVESTGNSNLRMAFSHGDLGPIYGVQWRKWPGKSQGETIDQVKLLIDGIKKNPNGRRHIVTAWNPTYLSEMGLPPCHRDFQCYVSNDGHLDLMMSIRSWDTALGGPFNIAQYALLTHLIARATNLKVRHLTINYGDAHLYTNHVDAISNMLVTRQPLPGTAQLVFNTDNTDIDGYKIEDFDIVGYESHPFVKLPIAV